MDLTVRRVNPEDAEEIAGILNPIIAAGAYTVFDTPFSIEDERKYIEGLPARALFLAAVDREAGRIVGFQSMEPFATYTRAFDHVGVMGTYVGESRTDPRAVLPKRRGSEKLCGAGLPARGVGLLAGGSHESGGDAAVGR
jgi:hypothetical protein